MATSHDGQPAFEEVLERVLAADPESFYSQATAFEEAVVSLHDAKGLLTKHRRALEDAWSNRVDQRFLQLDGLVRHLSALMSDMPTYPVLLRRIGDAILDSRRRLLDLRHLPAGADPRAVSDRDQQARKILDDLSGTYRQLGGQLPELPERTATGQLLVAPPPRHEAEVRGAGAGAGFWSANAMVPRAQEAEARDLAEKEACAPAPPAVFGGFAGLVTRPAAATPPARKVQSFNGFARLADQEDEAVLAARSHVPGVVAADGTAPQRERKHADTAEVAARPDRSTILSGVDKVAPVRLESTHAATPATPVVTSPTTTVTSPATAATVAGPAEVRPQVSAAGNSVLASTPATPAVAPAAPAASAHPAPLPSVAPQPPPLSMTPNADLGHGTASAANMLRPGLGVAVPPGVPAAPLGRGAEVWLRGDSGDWAATQPPAGQPGRHHPHDHRLGFPGDGKAAGQGEDAR